MLKRIVKSVISERDNLTPVLDYLSGRYKYHSRELWSELIAEKRIIIDGSPVNADAILKTGQCMEYRPREIPEPEVSFDVRVVSAFKDFAVLDKPGNLPCHPAGCFFNNTLWAALKEGRIPGLPPKNDIHFVSRLDRETSGLLVVAWTAQATSRIVKQLDAADAGKKYIVLVEGQFPETLTAEGWLYQDTAAAVSKKRIFTYEKPDVACETSLTRFRLLEYNNGISRVEAVLETGRTHQIRATMCSLGFPVVGDKIYGKDTSIYLRFLSDSMTEADRSALRMPRQALHATELTFGGMRFISPPPF